MWGEDSGPVIFCPAGSGFRSVYQLMVGSVTLEKSTDPKGMRKMTTAGPLQKILHNIFGLK